MFPNLQGSLLPIENSTLDPNNPSCLSNRTGIIQGCTETEIQSPLSQNYVHHVGSNVL